MKMSDELLPEAEDGTLPGVVCGAYASRGGGTPLDPRSPIDGTRTHKVGSADPEDAAAAVEAAETAFRTWRLVPAPARGALVRRIGELVRANKRELGRLITLEVGKIPSEAEGEIQEWVDVCDFAVGLSRQLHGLTIASERAQHQLLEQWHPLGPVGVITAFNFPAAVWSWNAMIALVCGDTLVWKPSEQTPLITLACHELVQRALADFPDFPRAVSNVVIGGADVGQALAADRRLPLVSATGSVAMGRKVATTVAGRLGRSLLELGGNNALVLTQDADLELALRAVVFAACGTCAQRCTSLRRLIVHRSRIDEVCQRLVRIYAKLPTGDPTAAGVLVGPLVNDAAWQRLQATVAQATSEGGELLAGGVRVTSDVPKGGIYVHPALVRMREQTPVMHEECFAPLLYILPYDDLDQAIELHNAVPQGLAGAIFTTDLRAAGRFTGPAGGDCGIVNVNIGTSGAEIGGAFGGEKDTGGGRESGSDAWKQYMRRVTTTINYGDTLPLAQGVRFDV